MCGFVCASMGVSLCVGFATVYFRDHDLVGQARMRAKYCVQHILQRNIQEAEVFSLIKLACAYVQVAKIDLSLPQTPSLVRIFTRRYLLIAFHMTLSRNNAHVEMKGFFFLVVVCVLL